MRSWCDGDETYCGGVTPAAFVPFQVTSRGYTMENDNADVERVRNSFRDHCKDHCKDQTVRNFFERFWSSIDAEADDGEEW
jgi:hypothetical protein